MVKLIIRRYLLATCLFSLWFSPTLQAHLLPAQRGTLNFVDTGAYMALSLPISAFPEIDDDKNGLISMIEFNRHRADIISRIQAGVVLSEKGNDHLLKGIMLSPVPLDEHSKATGTPLARVYVMGKFVLNSGATGLSFRNDLYGAHLTEHTFKISASRQAGQQKQVFALTPTTPKVSLFSQPEPKI